MTLLCSERVIKLVSRLVSIILIAKRITFSKTHKCLLSCKVHAKALLKPLGNYFLQRGPEKQQCLTTELIRNIFMPPIGSVY